MKTDIEKVINELAQAFLKAYRAVLASDVGINAKSGTNTLKGSEIANTAISTYKDNDGDIMVDLIVNHYIQFIESGRRKGAKFPPIEPIVKWCRKNNIPTDNSTVFLIRRAISRDGIMARPIMPYVWDDIDSQMESIYYDKLFNSIIKELTDYFHD